jgi:hypothetical protein
MSDRYVIVYRDGQVGHPSDRECSDALIEWAVSLGRLPAYRIRCRMKPTTIPLDNAQGPSLITKAFDNLRLERFKQMARPVVLDANRALYEVTGRRKPAGGET